MWKQVGGWYYLTALGENKLFAKLTEFVSNWKKRYVAVSCPDKFDFPTICSASTRNRVVKLHDNDKTAWCEISKFMESRVWGPLNA